MQFENFIFMLEHLQLSRRNADTQFEMSVTEVSVNVTQKQRRELTYFRPSNKPPSIP